MKLFFKTKYYHLMWYFQALKVLTTIEFFQLLPVAEAKAQYKLNASIPALLPCTRDCFLRNTGNCNIMDTWQLVLLLRFCWLKAFIF